MAFGTAFVFSHRNIRQLGFLQSCLFFNGFQKEIRGAAQKILAHRRLNGIEIMQQTGITQMVKKQVPKIL